MNRKEFRDLWMDDRLEEVDSHADPSWRHGCYMTDVFLHTETGKYYRASYQRSIDGEYNGIREGNAWVVEVTPVTKTVTVTEYVNVKAP